MLCAIDIYIMLSKHFRGIKAQTKTNIADKGSEFYNRSMKSFFQNNDIVMYSRHNEEKSPLLLKK